MATAIYWVRRDLRLADNQALTEALIRADRVIPVAVLDPAQLSATLAGERSVAFFMAGLRMLDAALRQRGSYLLVRRGEPAEVLATLRGETGASLIVAQEDASPFAQLRDSKVSATLPLRLVPGLAVHRLGSILKANGQPYTMFTPFRRTWRTLPGPEPDDLLPAPPRIPTPPDLPGDSIPSEPELPESFQFPPGEAEAIHRLRAFVTGDEAPIGCYARDRDRLDLEGTSMLSPYLRFGMVSGRQAVVAARLAAAGSEAKHRASEVWIDELIWRDFFLDVLYHFPSVLQEAFHRDRQAIPWENDPGAFEAWCGGRTGYPVVDAAMRQLAESGWIPNRARMIVASFLVKDLLIDWRWGERWFMRQLVDGEPASNNGGWQWIAGVGTDAAPYFRVFNPVLQGAKFDPTGVYVRRWVPELANVPAQFIHQPWRMTGELQRAAGCVLGEHYPLPIVEHGWARSRALAAYRHARGRDAS